jgi:hypothetical protein
MSRPVGTGFVHTEGSLEKADRGAKPSKAFQLLSPRMTKQV